MKKNHLLAFLISLFVSSCTYDTMDNQSSVLESAVLPKYPIEEIVI